MTNYQETTDAPKDISTTYSMGVGDFFFGSIETNGATHNDDWIAVSLEAGQTYTFAMVGVGALSLSVDDPFLYLVDSSGSSSDSGTWLASDDDNGPGNLASLTFTASATGTYYISARTYSPWDTGGYYMLSMNAGTDANFDVNMVAGALYRPDLSWSATAETGTTITYSFMGSGSVTDAQGDPVAFEQLTSAQISAVQAALAMFAEVADVTFQQVNPGGTSENATMRFAAYTSSTDGAGAYAYYPGSTASSSLSGDVRLNNDSVSGWSLSPGSYSFFALIHEIGHAMGLAHPGDYNAAPGVSITYGSLAQFIQDTHQYSVMSYFDESNTTGSYSSYPDTLMVADIAALHALYGANYSTRAGNTTYGFNTTESGGIYDFTVNTTPALSIWDGAGNDTIDVSGWSMSQVIDLSEGAFSDVGGRTGNLSIALGAVIENAIGGAGNDTITGNDADNSISGGFGNDEIDAGNGADWVFGGDGDDTIYGGDGDDHFLHGNIGNDTIYGGAGNDEIRGGQGDDTLYGEDGADTIFAGKGLNAVYAGDGDDIIYGGNEDDLVLHGNIGNDIVYGGAGNDEIRGGQGDDTLYGEDGADTIFAGKGLNAVYAGDGDDIIYGGNEDDLVLHGNIGNDIVYGGAGNDEIRGGQGDDTLYGEDGADTIFAGKGLNTVYAGAGDDTVYGGAESDTIDGGADNDQLNGGTGADVFVFQWNSGDDTIHDWENGTDYLDFTALQPNGITSVDDLTINIFADHTEILFASNTLTIGGLTDPIPTDSIMFA